jgi:putative restriction endonuclease
MTGGNEALANSHLEGTPVRVLRLVTGGPPKSPPDYRYDGLYYVDRYWPERPASHGFLIYRYRLLKATPDSESVVPTPPPPPGQPPRVPTTVQRIVRSTGVAQGVKEAHGYRCQVCGNRIDLPGGKQYAEAAHIRPLGLPHNGPDAPSNVLCPCPTDHVRFDHGAIHVDPSGHIIDTLTGKMLGSLRTIPSHVLDPAELTHHRDRWQLIHSS